MILVNKITAALIVWSIICVMIAVFAVSPAVTNLFTIESSIKEQDDHIAGSVSRANQIKVFKEFSRNESANLAKIDGLFVNAQTPLDIIDFLESSARDSGIKMEISSSSAVSNSAKNVWPSFDFQLTLSGKFFPILKFVKTVESGKYLVSVPSVSISSDQNQNVGQQSSLPDSLNASMILTAYVLNNEKK